MTTVSQSSRRIRSAAEVIAFLSGHNAAVLGGMVLAGLSMIVLIKCRDTGVTPAILLLLLLAASGVSTGMAIGWIGAGILLPSPADYLVSFIGSIISCLFGFMVGRLMQAVVLTKLHNNEKAKLMMSLLSANQFKVNFVFALSGVIPAGLQNMANGCLDTVEWLPFVMASVSARTAQMLLYTFVGSTFKGAHANSLAGLYQVIAARMDHIKENAQYQSMKFCITLFGLLALVMIIVWLSVFEAPRMLKELEENHQPINEGVVKDNIGVIVKRHASTLEIT